MKFQIKKGERYVISRELINSWERFVQYKSNGERGYSIALDGGTLFGGNGVTLNGLRLNNESKNKSYSKYIKIMDVNPLTEHFTEIHFKEIKIQGNDGFEGYIVVADSSVNVPDNFLNVVAESELEKYVTKISTELQSYFDQVDAYRRDADAKRKQYTTMVNSMNDMWNIELEQLQKGYDQIIENYYLKLDDTLFGNQEKVAYTKEIGTFTDSKQSK